jgi:thioredoxin reductase
VTNLRDVFVDVVVVGGGPAGLTAARELRRSDVERVIVLEREAESGGIPRHCFHPGYGLRDLRRSFNGPDYARRLTELAVKAGAEVRTEATATHWLLGGPGFSVTSPRGIESVHAKAVVLATGARERPRSARWVPGDRPAGIYTTGQLQQAVHLHGQEVGTRAVIVGAELVSFSALLTLAHAGVEVVAMVTDEPRVQTYPTVPRVLGLRHRFPVFTETQVVGVVSDRSAGRLTGVDLQTNSGLLHLGCDTIVFTGDWIPDHELARLGDIDIDAASLGPIVDTSLRTSRPGVFAAGNLVHPVETADLCALDGRAVAASVAEFLRRGPGEADVVDIVPGDGVKWIAPGILRAGTPAPHGRFTVWPARAQTPAWLEVRQGDRSILNKKVFDGVVPGRPVALRAGWQSAVDPTGGQVHVSVVTD